MESLGSRYTVSEVRITFNSKLDEAIYHDQSIPPHRRLAKYLANYKISPYRLANKFERDDKQTNQNPFNNVPCAGVSYYFKSTFIVNNEKVRGLIRISDHPASPEFFAKNGYAYGLSIVFDNKSVRVGKHNSVDATVYEYVKDSNLVKQSDIDFISSKFLEAGGLVKIEGGRVIQPGDIDFKRITRFSDKQSSREIKLFTLDDIESETANFMSSPELGIQVTAQKDGKGNYHLSDDDKEKFKYGDIITFYQLDGSTPVQLGSKLTVD
jgi:hypothetical protein